MHSKPLASLAKIALGLAVAALVTGTVGTAMANPPAGSPSASNKSGTPTAGLFAAPTVATPTFVPPTVATATPTHGATVSACVHARNAERQAALRKALAARKLTHHLSRVARRKAQADFLKAKVAALVASKAALKVCNVHPPTFTPPTAATPPATHNPHK